MLLRAVNVAAVVFTVVFTVVSDGLMRGASCFSVIPSSCTQRAGNYCDSCSRRKRWLGTRRFVDDGLYCYYNLDSNREKLQYSTQEEWHGAWRGNKLCRENTRGHRRRSTGASQAPTTLHSSSTASSPSSSAGLPSLDGLPGVGTTPVQQGVSSLPSSPHGRRGGRSRRGKYPVIELYRRNTNNMVAGSVSGGTIDRHDGNDDGGHNRNGSVEERLRPPYDPADDDAAAVAAVRRRPLTAMEHLSSVLRLESEQAGLMLESFPALADVHPDKLDLPAKLVSYGTPHHIYINRIFACTAVTYRAFRCRMVTTPGQVIIVQYFHIKKISVPTVVMAFGKSCRYDSSRKHHIYSYGVDTLATSSIPSSNGL